MIKSTKEIFGVRVYPAFSEKSMDSYFFKKYSYSYYFKKINIFFK